MSAHPGDTSYDRSTAQGSDSEGSDGDENVKTAEPEASSIGVPIYNPLSYPFPSGYPARDTYRNTLKMQCLFLYPFHH